MSASPHSPDTWRDVRRAAWCVLCAAVWSVSGAPTVGSTGQSMAPTGAAGIKASEPFTIGNTAEREDSDEWKWAVFLQGDDDTLASVQCVEYLLHASFKPPRQAICKRGSLPGKGFLLAAKGWGTFQLGVKVLFKDGRARFLTHDLRFSAQVEGWVSVPPSFAGKLKVPVTAADLNDGHFVMTLDVTRSSSDKMNLQPVAIEVHQDGSGGKTGWSFDVLVDEHVTSRVRAARYNDWGHPTRQMLDAPGAAAIVPSAANVGIRVLGVRHD
jgi:hypothetical protein